MIIWQRQNRKNCNIIKMYREKKKQNNYPVTEFSFKLEDI